MGLVPPLKGTDKWLSKLGRLRTPKEEVLKLPEVRGGGHGCGELGNSMRSAGCNPDTIHKP